MKYLTLLAPVLAAVLSLTDTTAAAAESLTYKTVGPRALKLLVDKPADWKATDRRPAMVYFFGGGWVAGNPSQFQRHSEYFASRGMVGIRVEYRLIPKGNPGPPVVCCADARSAMRYVRSHATELGIDPERIAAAGGSAGGHLAAMTALIDGLDDPADDTAVSCRPEALVLFNPVFNNGPGEWGYERVGKNYRDYSPAHHVAKGAPPTIVFLGENDKLIPVKVVKDFAKDMKSAGSRCDTHFYPGAGHGFFNSPEYYSQTVVEADKFLGSLGWLEGPPTLAPAP